LWDGTVQDDLLEVLEYKGRFFIRTVGANKDTPIEGASDEGFRYWGPIPKPVYIF
jgi:hypothetical protein